MVAGPAGVRRRHRDGGGLWLRHVDGPVFLRDAASDGASGSHAAAAVLPRQGRAHVRVRGARLRPAGLWASERRRRPREGWLVSAWLRILSATRLALHAYRRHVRRSSGRIALGHVPVGRAGCAALRCPHPPASPSAQPPSRPRPTPTVCSDWTTNGSIWLHALVGPHGSSGHAHRAKLAITLRAFGTMLLVDSGRFQHTHRT